MFIKEFNILSSNLLIENAEVKNGHMVNLLVEGKPVGYCLVNTVKNYIYANKNFLQIISTMCNKDDQDKLPLRFYIIFYPCK